MESIKLTRKQSAELLACTFPSYAGRKIKASFVESVTLHDLNWDGGTKCTYVAIRNSDCAVVSLASLGMNAPWVQPMEGAKIELNRDYSIACHSHFCGTDCGITFYVHPDAIVSRLIESRPLRELAVL